MHEGSSLTLKQSKMERIREIPDVGFTFLTRSAISFHPYHMDFISGLGLLLNLALVWTSKLSRLWISADEDRVLWMKAAGGEKKKES